MKEENKKATNERPVYLFRLAFFEAITNFLRRKPKPPATKSKDKKPKKASKWAGLFG